MTANPPPLRVERIVAPDPQAPAPRPAELSELEKLIFPRWMDHDPTTGGPHYLGYVMGLITIGLFGMLAVLALFVIL